MRQNTLFTVVAALFSLHAIPIKVLAFPPVPEYPMLFVEIAYNTPNIMEGDFVAANARLIGEHNPGDPENPRHIILEISQAEELARCYIERGTWDGCNYPVSPNVCYCASWHKQIFRVEHASGVYNVLRDLLNGRSSRSWSFKLAHPLKFGVDLKVDAAINLRGSGRAEIYVWNWRLGFDLQRFKQAQNNRGGDLPAFRYDIGPASGRVYGNREE